MGLEIFLAGQRFVFVRKCAVPSQFPGFEFSRVRGFAGVMLWNAALQIRSSANVFLLREIDAADDVDVPRRLLQPVFALSV
jgi:hypothetical protein